MASASLIGWLSAAGVKDSTGTLLASGQCYFYTKGTTTQTAVYADSNAATPLSQPVTLDAYGRADVYAIGAVKMVVHAAAPTSTEIKTYEDATGEHAEEVILNNAAFTGATGVVNENVGMNTAMGRAITSFGGPDFQYSPNSGTNNRTYSAVVEEIRRSPLDYGAAANGTTDDTAAVSSAIAAIKSAGGGVLILPPGKTLLVSSQFLIDFNNFTCEGRGWGSIIKSNTAGANVFNFNAATSWILRNFQIDTDSITGTVPAVDINAASNDGLIDHVYLNCEQECIDINASDRISIRDSRIVSVDAAAAAVTSIALVDADDIRIVSNPQISNTNGTCIDISGSSSRVATGLNSFTGTIGIEIDAATTGAGFVFRDDDMQNATTDLVHTGTTATVVKYSPVINSQFNVASANNLHHGGRNSLNITGTTQINLIHNSYPGHRLVLHFVGSVTVKDDQTTAGTYTKILLAGTTTDFAATAGDMLMLEYTVDGWSEISRTVV